MECRPGVTADADEATTVAGLLNAISDEVRRLSRRALEGSATEYDQVLRIRGGFVAGCLLMPDSDVEDILAYANAVAALNCRALGARGGLPTSDEVDHLLARV